jgi:hypothetical protein
MQKRLCIYSISWRMRTALGVITENECMSSVPAQLHWLRAAVEKQARQSPYQLLNSSVFFSLAISNTSSSEIPASFSATYSTLCPFNLRRSAICLSTFSSARKFKKPPQRQGTPHQRVKPVQQMQVLLVCLHASAVDEPPISVPLFRLRKAFPG